MNNIEKMYWDAIKEYFQTFDSDIFVFRQPGQGTNHTKLIAKYSRFDNGEEVFDDIINFSPMSVNVVCDCDKLNFSESFYPDETIMFGTCKLWNSKIDNLEPDFIIEIADENSTRFVIEIDGFEYHDRTKELAAKDKQKDRFYLSRGYIPIRFAGTEVYKDPLSCVRETMQIILNTVCINRKRDNFIIDYALYVKESEK